MLSTLRKQVKGFTLIELLIVVAIIGILAAIAIPNLLQARSRSNNSRAATDTKQIVTQAQLYINDHNCLPSQCTAPAAGAAKAIAAANSPHWLWNRAAPGNTVYMAATYDPWASGGAGNYFYNDQVTATTVLTAEVRAWSRGGNATNDSYAGDDIGYSNYDGGLNN